MRISLVCHLNEAVAFLLHRYHPTEAGAVEPACSDQVALLADSALAWRDDSEAPVGFEVPALSHGSAEYHPVGLAMAGY